MPVLIGTDEAGYGPNLGPLIITATAWSLPDNTAPADMWGAFDSVLTNAPSRGDDRLHVADSKEVYSSSRSIAPLERGVLACLTAIGVPITNTIELGTSVSGDRFSSDFLNSVGQNTVPSDLPLKAEQEACLQASENLKQLFSRTEIKLTHVYSRVVFPPEFNEIVDRTGSKGVLLSEATLKLVRRCWDESGASNGWVYCDKHGGRNRYDDIIGAAFDDQFVFRLEESRSSSRYLVGDLEFCFRTKAEELLPVALASMVSKYLREVVMEQFNAFWQQHVTDLKPTKGYPVDALRFWDDIQEAADRQGILKETIWRSR